MAQRKIPFQSIVNSDLWGESELATAYKQVLGLGASLMVYVWERQSHRRTTPKRTQKQSLYQAIKRILNIFNFLRKNIFPQEAY